MLQNTYFKLGTLSRKRLRFDYILFYRKSYSYAA